MRDLTQNRVMAKASAAAAITAFATYSRMVLWFDRPREIWFLEAVIFSISFLLWASVFAWHKKYSGRPVLDYGFRKAPWVAATVCGLGGAAFMYAFLDPVLRPLTPEVYPGTIREWGATTLFAVAFVPLLLCFGPLAFCLRLLPSSSYAAYAAVSLGFVVAFLKLQGMPGPVSTAMAAGILAVRGASTALSVWFYWEGGILPALWWTLLLESRHLAELF